MPYCIKIKEDNSIIVLNREYVPIGFNHKHWMHHFDKNIDINSNLPIKTKYKNFSEKLLESIADPNDAGAIIRDEKNKISEVYLYNDATNPTSNIKDNNCWNIYFEKIKKLSSFKIGE